MSHSYRLPLLLAALATSLVCAADPPAEAEAALRTSAENAEVHGIGVYQSSNHTIEQIKDLSGLVDALQKRKGPADRVWKLLSDKTQKLLATDDILAKIYQLEGIPAGAQKLSIEAVTSTEVELNGPLIL